MRTTGIIVATANRKIKLPIYFMAGAGLLAAASTHAATLSFGCINNVNVENCTAGAAQLSVDVTDLGNIGPYNQVRFNFNNVGPAASSITDVYFDDGTLLGIADLIDKDDGTPVGHAGVDFSPGASPPNLPGGNTISPEFNVTAGFLADSDSPVAVNGVNPGEWLGVIFNLHPGKTYTDVYDALRVGNGLNPGDDPTGTLRIGMRVQSFSDGGGESFVSNAFAVPIPAAIWLLGTALIGAGMIARSDRATRRQL